jgi:hypothetical protein
MVRNSRSKTRDVAPTRYSIRIPSRVRMSWNSNGNFSRVRLKSCCDFVHFAWQRREPIGKHRHLLEAGQHPGQSQNAFGRWVRWFYPDP